MTCPSLHAAAFVAEPHVGNPVMRVAEPHVGRSAAFAAQPYVGRAAAWLDGLARATAAGLAALRATLRAADREAHERHALRGLSAHMLRDIGASPSLVADATLRAHDARQDSLHAHPF